MQGFINMGTFSSRQSVYTTFYYICSSRLHINSLLKYETTQTCRTLYNRIVQTSPKKYTKAPKNLPIIPARQHQIVDQPLQGQAGRGRGPQSAPAPRASRHAPRTPPAPHATTPRTNTGPAALETKTEQN